jgi:hypothetical protein
MLIFTDLYLKVHILSINYGEPRGFPAIGEPGVDLNPLSKEVASGIWVITRFKNVGEFRTGFGAKLSFWER